jgi:uncharacterized protein (TIGR00730 family)
MKLPKPRLPLLGRLVWDFLKGLHSFQSLGPCVTVFGSARITSEHPAYEVARNMGRALSQRGFTVMTGGGPGLMEAANRGAHEAGGPSIGCKMLLPFESPFNPYLDSFVTFRYFFVRKVMLCRYSCAFVALPGGLGTLDELFELLTLIQTKRIAPMPIVLIGTDYWHPLIQLLEGMALARTVAPDDIRLMLLTDDIGEAIKHIEANGDASRRLPWPARVVALPSPR